MGQTSKIAY